jgi:hypothetical protein
MMGGLADYTGYTSIKEGLGAKNRERLAIEQEIMTERRKAAREAEERFLDIDSNALISEQSDEYKKALQDYYDAQAKLKDKIVLTGEQQERVV